MKKSIKKNSLMMLVLTVMSGSVLAGPKVDSSTQPGLDSPSFWSLMIELVNSENFFVSEPDVDSQIVNNEQEELLDQIKSASFRIDLLRHEDCSSTDSCQTLNEKFSELETALNTYTKQFKEKSKKCPDLNQVNLQFTPSMASTAIVLPQVKSDNEALYEKTLLSLKNMSSKLPMSIFTYDSYNLDTYEILSIEPGESVYVFWDKSLETWLVPHYYSTCKM